MLKREMKEVFEANKPQKTPVGIRQIYSLNNRHKGFQTIVEKDNMQIGQVDILLNLAPQSFEWNWKKITHLQRD